MDQTTTDSGPATHFHRNGADGGVLPPYTGEETTCSKCSNSEAYTRYRPVQTLMLVVEWNGQLERRGPLPERLERECKNCDFKWDEDLCPPGCGMTVEALAHALAQATPFPMETPTEALTYTARQLLNMVTVTARPDHPVWQYDAGRPAPAAATPVGICEAAHETREEEDECERRRTPQPVTPPADSEGPA